MNQARIALLLILSACALGCGGSAPRSEGPITSPWTEADDAALGMTSESYASEASTSGGEVARK